MEDLVKINIGCKMTMISELYTKILLSQPVFSVVYFFLSWVFIVCFIYFTVFHMCFKVYYQSETRPGFKPLSHYEEDIEEVEEVLLNPGA